jgi:hypothetical protein
MVCTIFRKLSNPHRKNIARMVKGAELRRGRFDEGKLPGSQRRKERQPLAFLPGQPFRVRTLLPWRGEEGQNGATTSGIRGMSVQFCCAYGCLRSSETHYGFVGESETDEMMRKLISDGFSIHLGLSGQQVTTLRR